jgi:hypothetical protein
MSNLHVNRDRQNLGQFSAQEVAEGLASGRFLPTDLAWHEGMDDWQPLSTFTDLPPAIGSMEATVAPGTPLSELASASVETAPAWERDSGGWFSRAYESGREILSNPQKTFASMPVTGGLKKPLLFVLLVGTICGLVSMIYSSAFEIMRPRGATPGEFSLQVTLIIYVVVAIFLPLLIALWSFITAGILHLCLMLVGAAPKSFEATFRVTSYAYGATSVFLLLPLCGSLVQWIWWLYATAIGFREVHGTTTAKAVIAVLLPAITCCGLGLGLVLLAASIPALSHMAK